MSASRKRIKGEMGLENWDQVSKLFAAGQRAWAKNMKEGSLLTAGKPVS